MAKKSKETLLHVETDRVLTLFKDLSKNLRERYGSHRCNHHTPLASEDNWTTAGDVTISFSTVGIYFYDNSYPFAAVRTAKGALWLEFYKTLTYNGKKIRNKAQTEITNIAQLAKILEWLTNEKDILCKNGDVWEYADEFHLWTFQD